jgi:hypothetical protein
LPDRERIKADLDEVSRPITLRCPECGSHYEWNSPLVVEEVRQAPSCRDCFAPYPMGCQDCGLDLTVDGFSAKVLKHGGGGAGGQQTWGLFCPECADAYDRFAVGEFELKPCAKCGKSVAAGELRLRQVNESVGVGARAFHRTTMVGVCSDCARGLDSGPRAFVSGATILLALVALFALVCWLMG